MNLVNNLKIQWKLLGLGILAAASLLFVTIIAALLLHARMIDERVAKLEALTETALGVAASVDLREKKGELSHEEALAALRMTVHNMRFEGGNYIFANTMDGVSLVHPGDPKSEGTNRSGNKDATGKLFTQEMMAVASQKGEGSVSYLFPRSEGTKPVPKITYVKRFAPWNAYFGAGVYVDDIDDAFWRTLTVLGGIGAATLVALALAGWWISRSVARPLGILQTKMSALAGGDLDVEIDDDTRRDEVGQMGRAVQVFKENAIAMARLRDEREEQKLRVASERRHSMLALAGRFETSVGGIVGKVAAQATELQTTARSMAAISDETLRQSTTVAAASEQATQNVNTVAAASEELSASANEILQQITRSTLTIGEALTEANSANQQMRGLATAVQKIGDVVVLINNIAAQTNLLALNATIEAARAGEAGKGFAVVAGEVKTLAKQTARATEEIATQVSAIQHSTSVSVQSIQGVNDRISNVSEAADAIAAAVEEQGSAIQEIARNVSESARGTREVSDNISGVNEAAQQAGVAASQVLVSANDLRQHSQALAAQVTDFLNEVRAA